MYVLAIPGEHILRLEKEMFKIMNEYKDLNCLESKELCIHLAGMCSHFILAPSQRILVNVTI